MKSLLQIAGFAVVLLIVSVIAKIIGGVAGEHAAKNKIASQSASFQAQLEQVSRELNTHLPKTVDENIRLETTQSGPERSLSYIHSLPKQSSTEMDLASIRDVLAQNAKATVCGSSEALTMLKGGITIHFVYNANDGVEVARSSFGSADCGA